MSVLAQRAQARRGESHGTENALASYRLQLNSGFTFADALAVLPYLEALGITDVYVSPILEAQAGSTHGYDTTSHLRLNPDLGGESGFIAFSDAIRRLGMRLLVDFVPNHMAIDTARNDWWRDVLAQGEASDHAAAFDIDWSPPWPELAGKVLLPLLGDDPEVALEQGKLVVEPDALVYADDRFPLRADSPPAAEPRQVLQAQYYRLASWREALWRINYRRFFDVNRLIGIRVEEPDVFERVHRFIGSLIAAGRVDGLRLDHIDGLYDPAAYLQRLSAFVARCGRDPRTFPIHVEKILAPGEDLPRHWPAAGTTGYEFGALLNGLFVDPAGYEALQRLYAAATGQAAHFSAVVAGVKRQVIEALFAADLALLVDRFERVATRRGRAFDNLAVAAALIETVVAMPVYRTYVTSGGIGTEDRQRIAAVIDAATQAGADPEVAAFLRLLLLVELPGADVADFACRFQQFTGPVMAKSLEDTAFYRHAALLSANEVGSDPRAAHVDIADFHAAMARRRRERPGAMLATATHDSKRGEDVRARLNVLSEIPDRWQAAIARWTALNRPLRPPQLAEADVYFFYQTLVGAWPLTPEPDFAQRLTDYMRKALREAKLHTDWHAPDHAYEKAMTAFVESVLRNAAFLDDFTQFHALVARCGALNALAQLVLKLTAPGRPDIYRGTEFWDLSLVDPDNRRPVDFSARMQALEQAESIGGLVAGWRNGRIKLHCMQRILRLRRRHRDVFASGSYRPLAVAGPAAGHAIAYCRAGAGRTVIVVAGRFFAALPAAEFAPVPSAWGQTAVSGVAGQFCNILDGTSYEARSGGLPLAAIFATLPVAVLVGDR